jgi:hypothetical protein
MCERHVTHPAPYDCAYSKSLRESEERAMRAEARCSEIEAQVRPRQSMPPLVA